jgi:uncharacterized protein (UPF0335 family)
MSSVETTVSHIGAQPPPIGHNKAPDAGPSKVAKDQLKAIVERIEAHEEEKKTLSDDIRDIYTEAKGNGYDVKALRTIVRLRKMKEGDRTEQEAILDIYKQALGMLV